MGAYDRAIATAQRMIREKGEPCVWAVPGTPTRDPDQPWLESAPGVPTQHNVHILMLPKNRQNEQLIRLLSKMEVIGGCMYGIMAYTPGLVPDVTGKVTRKNGKVIGISNIDPLGPNGDDILYTIEFEQ
jgi:hypothetical protein